MHDLNLKERVDKVSPELFKRLLLEELNYQKELPGNGSWMHCFVQFFQAALQKTNGNFLASLEEEEAGSLKEKIFAELKKQKTWMEEQKTNYVSPVCSLLLGVLERVAK